MNSRRPVNSDVMPYYLLNRSLLVVVLITCPFANAVVAVDLSDADKAAIIQAAMELRLARVGKEEFAQFRIFSTDNMSPALLPVFDGIRFSLMRPQVIERNQRHQSIFRYLRIGKFSGDADHVNIKLGIIETRGGLGFHVHSYEYSFTRTGDKWQGKIVWVIC
jgi:hypothetical protein